MQKKITLTGDHKRKSIKKSKVASVENTALVAGGAAATWISSTRRRTKSSDPDHGDKVCAMWKNGGVCFAIQVLQKRFVSFCVRLTIHFSFTFQAFYWGVVKKKIYVNQAPLYNIHFDDGDKRNRIPRAQVLSVGEFVGEYGEEAFERTSKTHLQKYEVNDEIEADNATKASATTKEGSIDEDEIHNHPLLGVFVLRKWLDISFNNRSIRGKVVACRRDSFNENTLEFEIEYPDLSSTYAKEFLPSYKGDQRELIPEGTAWGCSHAFEYGDKIVAPKGAPVWKWIIPDSVINTLSFPPKRRLIVTEKNVIIDLEVRQSSIPNAGLGLFAKVLPTVPTAPGQQRRCVLKYGEMIDLGIYSPILGQDIRPNSELLVKSFIFDGKPEEWAYGQNDIESDHSFDITDDVTGDLHYMAKRNVLVYANEITGKQTATVHAQRDPFSHIHYMFGPEDAKLSLPFDKWFELLMDYKEDFETTRIRKGYSRLPDGARRKEVERTDSKTINALHKFSVDEVKASISYLYKLELSPIAARARVRSLVVALCLRARYVDSEMKQDGRSSEEKTMLVEFIARILDSISYEDLQMTFEDLRKHFTNDDPWRNETSFTEFLKSHVGVRKLSTGWSLAQLIRHKILRD